MGAAAMWSVHAGEERRESGLLVGGKAVVDSDVARPDDDSTDAANFRRVRTRYESGRLISA